MSARASGKGKLRAVVGKPSDTEEPQSEEDIEILEDLSPILHRPGMYTDPQNPNHALVEIIDNSSDEGLAGHLARCGLV